MTASACVCGQASFVFADEYLAEFASEVFLVDEDAVFVEDFLDVGEVEGFDFVDEGLVVVSHHFQHACFLGVEFGECFEQKVDVFFGNVDGLCLGGCLLQIGQFRRQCIHQVGCDFDFFGGVVRLRDVHVNESIDDVDLKGFFEGDVAVVGDKDAVFALQCQVAFKLFDFVGAHGAGVVFVFEQNGGFVFVSAVDAVVAGGGVCVAVHDFVAGKQVLKNGIQLDFGHVAFGRRVVFVFV